MVVSGTDMPDANLHIRPRQELNSGGKSSRIILSEQIDDFLENNDTNNNHPKPETGKPLPNTATAHYSLLLYGSLLILLGGGSYFLVYRHQQKKDRLFS